MRYARSHVEELFESAIQMPATQRRLWLAIACADDSALEAEVLGLIAAHERAGILDLDAGEIARELKQEEREESEEGRTIGAYRIAQELGRGGMGVVYLAFREDGQFRRRVALKLLRGSPDAAELYQRFLAERQILAALQHPNIAQLLDGGVTDGRLPYLVMEYVEGVPITEYCNRRQLDVTARLRLFLNVCMAVHHAHKNLVLHRDLKPGNVLVTETGQVKLLDFGIAKLLNPVLSGVEVPITRTEDRVLTPEYASPEQIRGDTLSTASDVYSLGVVLYEMLSGRPPYRLNTRSPKELTELICEREPERPSTMLMRADTAEAIAAARSTTPHRLQRQLRGDLDAIVMVALRKESARRYGSAELLMQDIVQYLEGRPVLARRGSRRYRAGKFLHRHRIQAIAAGVVALSVCAGAGSAIWQGSLARRERDRTVAALAEAEQALRQSEEITRYLTLLFEANDPEMAQGAELSARDLLRRGIRQADQLNGQPLVQAAMFDVLGRVQSSLGEYAEARRLFERALELRLRQRGELHAQVAGTLVELGAVQTRLGLYPEAETHSRKALTIYQRLPTPVHADVARVLSQLSSLAVYRGELDAAELLAQQARQESERAPAEDVLIRVRTLILLGSVERRQGKYGEAESTFSNALNLAQEKLGADHPSTSELRSHLGFVLVEQPDRVAEAETLFRAVVESRRRTLGPDHPMTAYALTDLGQTLQRTDRHEEALPLFRQAYAILERSLSPTHPLMADAKGTLGSALARAGLYDEAEQVQRESVALAEHRYGPAHTSTAGSMSGLAAILVRRGKYDEAEQFTRRALAIRMRLGGPNAPIMAVMNTGLADVLIHRRKFAEAELALQQACDVLDRNRIPPIQLDYRNALVKFVTLYEAWGKPAEADRYRTRLAGD